MRRSEWINKSGIPSRVTFCLLGIASTMWFLIRVIPKPARASYPCMRVAAPFMSAFVVYLLSMLGIGLALRNLKKHFLKAHYLAATAFLFVALLGMALTFIQGSQRAQALSALSVGPDDGPNQPMGNGIGIHPGRVVWAWNPDATDKNCQGYFHNPLYSDQDVIGEMFSKSVKKLAGESTVPEAWDAVFRSFNKRKFQLDRGYVKGEKIFIKINQTTGVLILTPDQRKAGDYDVLGSSPELEGPPTRACQTTPYVALELLRHLVNHCGIAQSDIAIGDPQNPTLGHNYDAWSSEFPDVVYTDRLYGTHGRTLIHATTDDLLLYSDRIHSDKLYDVIEEADYMINLANFKPHSRAGLTLTAKNHFGTQSRESANHLHYSHVAPIASGVPTNTGYRKYRVMVDMMGSRYLGRNTLLFIVDGLFGGGSGEIGPPVKYFMTPFNNDWCNSIFISEDQVALESVCYDFLRTEWNGINKHSPANNTWESMPSVNGVDDYLHQAAEKSHWPDGFVYDPDGSGEPLPSLGVHEHWNGPDRKEYSGNLGNSSGIELLSIPSRITGPWAARSRAKMRSNRVINPIDKKPAGADSATSKTMNIADSKFVSVENQSFSTGFSAKEFYSGFIDRDDRKWYLTDNGIAFGKYTFFDSNIEPPIEGLKQFSIQSATDGEKVWFATPHGVYLADLPYSPESEIEIFNTENSPIASDSIVAVLAAPNNLQWIGTSRGLSAFHHGKWLNAAYEDEYPDGFFKYFPITTMASTQSGDSLFVATRGAGVGRFHRNELDAISGASSYARWGPCVLPSDNVYSIFISGDTQWYGTDAGLARHKGYEYKTGWAAYNTLNGLVHDFVQAIGEDPSGKLWVGTRGGISVLDGDIWTNYTIENGLISNNILSIICDPVGDVYIGTDNGFMVYSKGSLICFQ